VRQLQEGLLSAVNLSYGTGAIKSLVNLGITANAIADGTISLDADRLSTALNNNFDQVVSFFQDTGNFGLIFAKTLSGLGSSSTARGAISLAMKENSSQETTLNGNITKQEALIAAQRVKLTKELSLANQILQAIPDLVNQVDQMYSAITGYNTHRNG
jgi:flagellar hook-associated protein 2